MSRLLALYSSSLKIFLQSGHPSQIDSTLRNSGCIIMAYNDRIVVLALLEREFDVLSNTVRVLTDNLA